MLTIDERQLDFPTSLIPEEPWTLAQELAEVDRILDDSAGPALPRHGASLAGRSAGAAALLIAKARRPPQVALKALTYGGDDGRTLRSSALHVQAPLSGDRAPLVLPAA